MTSTAVIDAPAHDWVPGDLDAHPADGRRSRAASLLRGRPDDPAWVRPALFALLVVTAGLYLWDLGASGWANSFYSGAVQAGSKSWKAFFFGSFDSSNFITVDKPPAALWVMDISARIFGVNSWSILVPNALEGVAAVGFLYLTVRRWFSPAAALLSGAVMALTPVAALMFRFNNPDAFLVLVLTAAAYATVRAVEDGRTRWIVLAGSLVGFGFLVKMLQAFLVAPAIALVFLVAAPGPVRRRLGQLALAGVAMLLSAFWWVAAVMLIPAADRPYIGGSQNNSLWNLIFGYNGFGRITGNETGSVGGAPAGGGGGQWGPTGLTRLFQSDMGSQISWLLPAALILLVAGLAYTSRARRTDRTRAALILWGGWLLVTGAVFSLSKGIIHPYYTVALAPAIGALIGVGGATVWSRRTTWTGRAVLSGSVAASAVWAFVLMGRSPTWMPELRSVVLVVGLTAAGGILALPWLDKWSRRALVVAALAASLAGPAAWTLDTVANPQSGAIPSAGPVTVGAQAGPGRGPGGQRGGLAVGGRGPGGGGFGGPPAAFAGGTGTGTFPGAGGLPGAGAGLPGGAQGRVGGGGAAGGLLNASTPSQALVSTLKSGASKYTWVLAVVGANDAAGYQLATDDAVMAIGGFNGTDPTPTLAAFEQIVAAGKIHYFIAGGGGAGPAAGASSSQSQSITSWVESHFTSTTVGGVTLYNLTTAS
jgi:4-amino-4-deoxy-L-arabinose transferase-like glycosyltransferase